MLLSLEGIRDNTHKIFRAPLWKQKQLFLYRDGVFQIYRMYTNDKYTYCDSFFYGLGTKYIFITLVENFHKLTTSEIICANSGVFLHTEFENDLPNR